MEARYNATLSLREFEAISLLGQEAAEAELAEYPDVRVINVVQAKSAERAHASALDVRAQRLPAGMLDRLQNMETAEPSEACRWAQEMLGAALDLSEPYRGWWMTRYVESLQ